MRYFKEAWVGAWPVASLITVLVCNAFMKKKTFCIFSIFASDIIICYLCESYNSEHTEPEFGVFLAYLQRIETEQQ